MLSNINRVVLLALGGYAAIQAYYSYVAAIARNSDSVSSLILDGSTGLAMSPGCNSATLLDADSNEFSFRIRSADSIVVDLICDNGGSMFNILPSISVYRVDYVTCTVLGLDMTRLHVCQRLEHVKISSIGHLVDNIVPFSAEFRAEGDIVPSRPEFRTEGHIGFNTMGQCRIGSLVISDDDFHSRVNCYLAKNKSGNNNWSLVADRNGKVSSASLSF